MVSVIIPTYNRAEFLPATLDSVINQTCSNWEIIIVDDGSTDRTHEVVQKYISEYPDKFFFIERPADKTKGAPTCRNIGFEHSHGTFIKFLDSDDLIKDNTLERQAKIMEQNPNLKVCFSYGTLFDSATGEYIQNWSPISQCSDFLLYYVTGQIKWAVSDPLWKKEFFRKPPFKEGLQNSQEWLMHGLALTRLNDSEIYNLQETLSYIRSNHSNQISSNIRSSKYYGVRKKARFILLIETLRKGKILPKYYMPLIKLIVHFQWMQMRLFIEKLYK